MFASICICWSSLPGLYTGVGGFGVVRGVIFLHVWPAFKEHLFLPVESDEGCPYWHTFQCSHTALTVSLPYTTAAPTFTDVQCMSSSSISKSKCILTVQRCPPTYSIIPAIGHKQDCQREPTRAESLAEHLLPHVVTYGIWFTRVVVYHGIYSTIRYTFSPAARAHISHGNYPEVSMQDVFCIVSQEPCQEQ